jgi:hypothetical protein
VGSAPRKDATKKGQILNIFQNKVKLCRTFEKGSNLSKSTENAQKQAELGDAFVGPWCIARCVRTSYSYNWMKVRVFHKLFVVAPRNNASLDQVVKDGKISRSGQL